jgi:hypothetical protein
MVTQDSLHKFPRRKKIRHANTLLGSFCIRCAAGQIRTLPKVCCPFSIVRRRLASASHGDAVQSTRIEILSFGIFAVGFDAQEPMNSLLANPDDNDRLSLTARIPQNLDDLERQRMFDRPLREMMHAAGIAAAVRGVSSAGADAGGWVEIEVAALAPHHIPSIVKALLALGAPPATHLTLETTKASINFTLAEALGTDMPGRGA